MKKVLLIIAALFVGMQAQAQIVADGGYFHAFENGKNLTYSSPSQDGLFLGARYRVDLDDWMDGLTFIPGVNISALKGKVLVSNLVLPKTTTREIAINLPIQLKYQYEFMSNFAVYGFLGPTLQLGFLNNVVDKSDNSTLRYNMYKENKLGVAPRTPFNLYLGLGLGVEVSERILVNAAFDFGLLNLTTGQNQRLHRHVLKIGVGYIF
jgi:hypothetical protein